jgi:hypothetical protein
MQAFTGTTPLSVMPEHIENTSSPVTCRVTDYRYGWKIQPHTHSRHQLICPVRGAMIVRTPVDHPVVPPSRALWMPAAMTHSIRCIGVVHMRSVFVPQEAASRLMTKCSVVGSHRWCENSCARLPRPRIPMRSIPRDGCLMRLMLDELQALAVLPLHLPMERIHQRR